MGKNQQHTRKNVNITPRCEKTATKIHMDMTKNIEKCSKETNFKENYCSTAGYEKATRDIHMGMTKNIEKCSKETNFIENCSTAELRKTQKDKTLQKSSQSSTNTHKIIEEKCENQQNDCFLGQGRAVTSNYPEKRKSL